MSEALDSFVKGTIKMDHTVLATEVMDGILADSVEASHESGYLLRELWCRCAALIDSFIETVQISEEKGDFHEINTFLAALRFRYCENKEKKGN